MKRCVLCGEMTSGSVGRAGFRWTMICQECKDREDEALEVQVKGLAEVFNLIAEY